MQTAVNNPQFLFHLQFKVEKNHFKFQENELDIQMQVKSPDSGFSLVYLGWNQNAFIHGPGDLRTDTHHQ